LTGNAIYVYGSVDKGIYYSWAVNSSMRWDGKPNGNLLIAAEDLKFDESGYPHKLDIIVHPMKSGARFQFNKADAVLGTGMTG
jgi:hypothetical protein